MFGVSVAKEESLFAGFARLECIECPAEGYHVRLRLLYDFLVEIHGVRPLASSAMLLVCAFC